MTLKEIAGDEAQLNSELLICYKNLAMWDRKRNEIEAALLFLGAKKRSQAEAGTKADPQ